MKKISTILLTMLMLLTSLTVFAEGEEGTELDEDNTTGTADITYSLTEEYTVIIPASFTMDGSEKKDNPVEVNVEITSFDVAVGHGAVVRVTSENDCCLTNGESTIYYNIGFDDGRVIVGGLEKCEDIAICVGYDYSAYPISEYSVKVDNSEVIYGDEQSLKQTMEFYFDKNSFKDAKSSGDYIDTLTFTCSIEDLIIKKLPN